LLMDVQPKPRMALLDRFEELSESVPRTGGEANRHVELFGNGDEVAQLPQLDIHTAGV
jgi:hypothetical protein